MADVTEDRRFQAWMAKVDAACQRLAGLSIYDLPDQDFRGEFESRTGAVAMARRALREEGWPG